MQHRDKPLNSFINRAEYRDKVLGCWTGKNIGGTLGAPIEGRREMFDLSFYMQDLKGTPAPNDDLDLQLVWLHIIERYGIYNITERLLGEHWLSFIVGPWNEYGVGKFNMVNGLLPPLSGLANNSQWQNSNGAWIRSEIWACLFPGEPDEAVQFAWMDACVDHADDGIYAELFTTALESAAFIESDIQKLISIGLGRIPEDCRVARSVGIAVAEYKAGSDWQTARNKIVADSEDLGWFQAPANVGFLVIGLLWGEGDFGKSICTAVNCGDDTDCTGATCGSILGIINGRSKIPQKWIDPIGETIKTVAVSTYMLDVPETLGDLTDRVIVCKQEIDFTNPTVVRLTDGKTTIEDEISEKLSEKNVYKRSSRQLNIDLPYGALSVEYATSPVVKSGESQKLQLNFTNPLFENLAVTLKWHLPESWTISPAAEQTAMTLRNAGFILEVEVTPGEFEQPVMHIPVEVYLTNHNYPVYITIPFQLEGTVSCNYAVRIQKHWDGENRRKARKSVLLEKK